ncbi:hypothetical protein GUITHDRAFT_100348 [Guillardia theta CCMP2712]|uniref:Mitochondrial carrier protein n=1 Tax=Guillardia theta (strain CCMP2712) TaxID=905079 RepID=L1JZR6_GUITC|nr:hypothetical protein GUITHDRAFT_100348 [Guillardia theta CCMP2712]EKX54101.1 hypothetical protein GUITHDRAFT_100348 [Guillardia theta CCMP2712]|eukprot:XP_005841081.1 hypothetical protein GUITHDRAFT_100348 [Guillardia theta CCMP2712]
MPHDGNKCFLRGYEIPCQLRGILSGIAGGLAGSSVSFLLHPLDTLKTMKQADSTNKFSGWIDGGLKAVKERGLYHGLYAGARTAAAGSFISSFLYFSTYESMKGVWSNILPDKTKNFSPSLAAMTGNAVSSLIFVPKEVLKQRCQVGQLASGQKALSLMKDIIQREGIGAMYNGYFATLLRNAPGAMLKFGIYEQIKAMMISRFQRQLEPAELFGAGITAGSATFFAVGISTYEIALANILKIMPSTSAQDLSCSLPQSAEGRQGIGLPSPSRIPGMIKRFYDDSVVSAQVMLTK